MSNSDIENKVYFGVHSEKSVVTDMLTKPIWIDKYVTAMKNEFVIFRGFLYFQFIRDMEINSRSKIPKFFCEKCNYKTDNKKDYKKHTMTAKHKMETERKSDKSPQHYECGCGRRYQNSSGLWKHKKKCNAISNSNLLYQPEACNEVSINDNSSIETINPKHSSNLVVKLLQEQKAMREENKEMREAMMQQHNFIQQQQEQHNKQIQELIPKLQQVTTINNNSNNTTTNKFNLNFFLNEQCKDAISIQTFIENLDIGIKELEHMGNVGYLQGMMTIMSNTLGAMDVYKRPVHCTDLKRETVYIKDGDTWKKDNANNDDLRRVINTVANVNYRNLDVWESQHPDAFESDTPDNIEYCKIAMESLGGYDNSDDKIAIKLNKLVKHVVREVYVK